MIATTIPLIVTAASAAAVAVSVVSAVTMDRKDKDREMILSMSAGIIEEAIAISEVESLPIKRQAVVEATKSWQKQQPEILKDQIKADKFLAEALKPARYLALQKAVEHVQDTIHQMPKTFINAEVARLLGNKARLEQAIAIRITASKINIPDPVRPYLYRFL